MVPEGFPVPTQWKFCPDYILQPVKSNNISVGNYAKLKSVVPILLSIIKLFITLEPFGLYKANSKFVLHFKLPLFKTIDRNKILR